MADMRRWLLIPLALSGCATTPKTDSGNPAATGATTPHKPIDGYAEFDGLFQAAAIKRGRKLAREHLPKERHGVDVFEAAKN